MVDVGVLVEERRWSQILPAGILAGLIGGVALAVAQTAISLVQGGNVLEPFRMVAALVLGQQALMPDTSTALLIILGVTVHFVLAAIFGLLFVWLLALNFQLSARPILLFLYGILFGFLLFEANFLAALPLLFPDIVANFGVKTQLWRGIVAYSFVYGPALGLTIAALRPGVRAEWANA